MTEIAHFLLPLGTAYCALLVARFFSELEGDRLFRVATLASGAMALGFAWLALIEGLRLFMGIEIPPILRSIPFHIGSFIGALAVVLALYSK